jgi:hypothetical protein
MWGWRRRQQTQDPRQLLAEDARRAAGFLHMVLIVARKQDAPDTMDATKALFLWKLWAEKVRDWADR